MAGILFCVSDLCKNRVLLFRLRRHKGFYSVFFRAFWEELFVSPGGLLGIELFSSIYGKPGFKCFKSGTDAECAVSDDICVYRDFFAPGEFFCEKLVAFPNGNRYPRNDIETR